LRQNRRGESRISRDLANKSPEAAHQIADFSPGAQEPSLDPITGPKIGNSASQIAHARADACWRCEQRANFMAISA
jgi:hypothetical protein